MTNSFFLGQVAQRLASHTLGKKSK